MTPDEIRAIYQLGPEAICGLVEGQHAQIDTLAHQVSQLQERIKELEAQLGQNSRNSSKPPSSDKARWRQKRQRPKSDRPSGGQKGHPGHHLALSERPDQVHELPPEQCTACGNSLADAQSVGEERRQVFELPPLALEVTEYRAQTKRCPQCSQNSSGQFPAQVSDTVQYGPKVAALVSYLHSYQLLPQKRTGELFEHLFGHRLSDGTVNNMRDRCAEGLVEFEHQVKEAVGAAPVVNFDETGFYVNTKRYWLHSASTPKLTYYAWHPKRGKQAMDEIGILPDFEGVAVHDAYSSYFVYECEHSLCNAHLIRDLTAVVESDPEQQEWAEKMRRLMGQIKACLERSRKDVRDETQKGGGLTLAQLGEFEARYDELLTAGERANPPPQKPSKPKRGSVKKTKAQNLLARLRKYHTETLRFMYDFRVPFDNNLAERDIRMLKVQQKISGCFRSKGGATSFCRVRSYISTVRKQGIDVLQALEGVFTGHPFSLVPQEEAQLAA